MDKFETWLTNEVERVRHGGIVIPSYLQAALAEYQAYKAELLKPSKDDDPLIAEIEKMIAVHKRNYRTWVHAKACIEELEQVHKLVIADRERMVKALEDYKPTREQQLDNPLLCLGMTSGVNHALEVNKRIEVTKEEKKAE